MTLAKVTCTDCGWTWTQNCSLGYDSEKYFYLNFRPEWPSCKTDPGKWRIEEVLGVRPPLTEDEISLFSLAGGFE
jgi:hypothetical protein